MIQSPIHKALSAFRNSNARFLLMGGQACILYGGAEFSRDIDLSIGVDSENLGAVKHALAQLEAHLVFLPALEAEALQRGHACHFRCQAEGVKGLRIDLMTRMRGCPEFSELWDRRSIVDIPGIGEIGLLSLPDLVRAKRTQREKDWPMIRRLVETDMSANLAQADEPRIVFWLEECRTPILLSTLAKNHPTLCKRVMTRRPLLETAVTGDLAALEDLLHNEEKAEREVDRMYWQPLRMELEQWRRQRKEQGA
ncbi:MAG: hypothetical protein JW955_17565 [Sedimentisphaerales bacterium]|nr:hypothetical protein [Sedimentisphaerales bacterium]